MFVKLRVPKNLFKLKYNEHTQKTIQTRYTLKLTERMKYNI